jgi:predicted SprT family Zn-dependent metalloprotease
VSPKIESNADHPYEDRVVDLVTGYLVRAKWPFKRIPVKISFEIRAGTPSDNEVKLKFEEAGEVTGMVKLSYNSLYLIQFPSEFLNDVVPHEVAHILDQANAFKQGREIQSPHGDSWKTWLATIDHRATPKASGPGDIFDDRAIRLQNGGIPARCACAGSAGFHVISSRSVHKLRSGRDFCSICARVKEAVPHSETPADVQFTLDYLRSEYRERHA